MVDPRGETDAGGLRLRVSQQGLQALFQSKLADIERAQAFEDAAIGLLQGFRRLQDALRERACFRLATRFRFRQCGRIGADRKQEQTKLVVKLPRELAPSL